MSEHPSFHERVARRFIELMQTNNAPWQKPWVPGTTWLPYNPISQRRYHGINSLVLMSHERQDSRWMTYRQAQEHGCQVRKGEKGVGVEYWLFPDAAKQREGETVQSLRHSRPKVFYSTVFNAEQIDGVPPVEVKSQAWNPIERAEEILRDSGARIFHSEYDEAFYSSATDSIHLPRRGQFKSAETYYETALHELGHWTGHGSRLNRILGSNRRSPEYAKEELRAEIASMMMCAETGITRDPTNHAAYVKSWIKALQDDPREIFRAAADAEKIQTYLLGLNQRERAAETMKNPLTMAMPC